jgi:MFS family permease
MALYILHAQRTASPVLDFSLLKYPTLYASVTGGFLYRLGIGASPFLLPLLMQVGFGLSPFKSGLITFASSIGAIGMKTLAARIIRTFGFRNIMVINAVVSSFFLAAYALFTATTPLLLIMIILIVGGFLRSLQFTAINTIAYAEISPAEMSRATTLVSVNQQLAISAGVAIGAFSVEMTMAAHHAPELTAGDFWPAFVVVAVLSAASVFFFWKLQDDAGQEISGHKIGAPEGPKAAETAAIESTPDSRDQRLG